MARRFKKTVLALLVLVIPVLCYMLLRTGTNYYQRLPVFGPEGMIRLHDSLTEGEWFRVNDSLFHVPEAAGTSGGLWVTGFVSGRSSPEAETLAVNLARLSLRYKELEKLRFMTFIATDSVSAPTEFERVLERYHPEARNWELVRLPHEQLRHLMRQEFLLHARGGEQGEPLSDSVVLLDSRRRIRGYYDGTSYFGTDSLKGDIVVLIKEELNEDDTE